jgi:hypothetical protein
MIILSKFYRNLLLISIIISKDNSLIDATIISLNF